MTRKSKHDTERSPPPHVNPINDTLLREIPINANPRNRPEGNVPPPPDLFPPILPEYDLSPPATPHNPLLAKPQTRNV